MNCPDEPKYVLISRRFDAVIFDLDGVVTDTASLHASAWKEMFDAALEEIPGQTGGSQQPFDKKDDYLRYVDGKPRFDGVVDFLASREIELATGQPDDPSEKLTVYGLGKRKNQLFQQKLEAEGVTVYDSSIRLVRSLRDRNVKTAVVSSSKNCRPILTTAGTCVVKLSSTSAHSPYFKSGITHREISSWVSQVSMPHMPLALSIVTLSLRIGS